MFQPQTDHVTEFLEKNKADRKNEKPLMDLDDNHIFPTEYENERLSTLEAANIFHKALGVALNRVNTLNNPTLTKEFEKFYESIALDNDEIEQHVDFLSTGRDIREIWLATQGLLATITNQDRKPTIVEKDFFNTYIDEVNNLIGQKLDKSPKI